MAAKKSAMAKPKPITIRPWVYIRSGGDGSASVCLFNTEKEAEAYAEPDDERLCEDIKQLEIKLDPVTFKVLNVDVRKDEDEDDE